tara:strand:+ start:299 stop:772 length:474 start_codon:yes stop_codon:yes gene_type:complete
MNKSVRNTTKKLNTYQSKHPGVVDEKHEELRRNVIIANLSVARHEEKMKKVEERVLFNATTDDEFLDQSYQMNAELNSEKYIKEQKLISDKIIADKKKKKNLKNKKQKQNKKKREQEPKLNEYNKVLNHLYVNLALQMVEAEVDHIKKMKTSKSPQQ